MFRLFLFILFFAPLAFGTVEPWSYAVMEIFSFAALTIFFIKAVRNNEDLYAVPGIIPLLLFLFYILFQIIPLPSGLVRVLSPAAYMIHQNALTATDSLPWMPLSIHPAAGLAEFFRWATYVVFYVFTVQLLKRKEYLKKTVITVTIFGALLSFSSILQFYLTENMALWFRQVLWHSIVVGPYINHNHYAGLMEMIFPIVLALFFFHRPRTRSSSLLKGIVEIMSQEKANIHILIGMAALLIVTSVFVSLSRGGMLSLCLSLIFFTALLFKRMISRGNTLLIIVVIMLTGVSVGWFGWDQIFERFESLKKAHGVIYEARLDFWKDSKHIIMDFPVTGSGIGTYIDIYPSYQSIFGHLTVPHAHNDYIELAAEGGIVGMLIVGAFLISLFFKTYQTFLMRKDAYAVYIYMGSVTGLLAILIHSVTDFNLHIGANGLWFFFLAGLAVSAANTGIRANSRVTRLEPVSSPYIRTVTLITLSVMMVCTIAYNISTLTGQYYFSHIRRLVVSAKTPVEDLNKIAQISNYASRFDPLSGDYFFARANAEWFLERENDEFGLFAKAIRLNPTNHLFLNRLGLIFAKKGAHAEAGKLLKASVTHDVSNAENTLQYGAWLLSQNNVPEGVRFIKKAITLNNKMVDNALVTMAVYGVSDEEIKSAVPEIPGPTIAYAEFLFNSGKKRKAEEQYLLALDYIGKQRKINRWQFDRIHDFFKKRGKRREAIEVMKKATELLPLDAGVRISLGDLYREMGITYRAKEEYEQALFIDSNNHWAKKRLDALNKINP